jgi:hypothetical protein
MTQAEETRTQHGLTCARTAPVLPGGYLDQLVRLRSFQREHPAVVIGAIEFGCWQALVPEPDGETVRVRHWLRELLDKLAETLGEPARTEEDSCLYDHSSEAGMLSETFRYRCPPDQQAPERWQASAFRCPCGFATDDVEEFDGHLEATADRERNISR